MCTKYVQGDILIETNRIVELVEKISSLIPEGSYEFKDELKNNISKVKKKPN